MAKDTPKPDELDARIDARIRLALQDFSVEHGWLHADDRDAAVAAVPAARTKDGE